MAGKVKGGGGGMTGLVGKRGGTGTKATGKGGKGRAAKASVASTVLTPVYFCAADGFWSPGVKPKNGKCPTCGNTVQETVA